MRQSRWDEDFIYQPNGIETNSFNLFHWALCIGYILSLRFGFDFFSILLGSFVKFISAQVCLLYNVQNSRYFELNWQHRCCRCRRSRSRSRSRSRWCDCVRLCVCEYCCEEEGLNSIGFGIYEPNGGAERRFHTFTIPAEYTSRQRKSILKRQ